MKQHSDLRGNLEEETLYFTQGTEREKCQSSWIWIVEAPDILGKGKIREPVILILNAKAVK